MTKGKYLRSLRNKLRFKFPQSTINSVIKDYDEYFEVGIANKQTIEEMTISIGSPLEVAKSLEDERDNFALVKSVLRLFIGIMFIYYSYFFAYSTISNTLIVSISSMIVITGPLGIWLILGGDFSHNSIQDLRKIPFSSHMKKITFVTVLLYFCSLLFIMGSAYYIVSYQQLPFSISDKFSGQYVFMLENGYTFIIVPLIIMTFNASRKYYINTLPILFLEFGLLYSVRVLFYQYGNSNLVPEKMYLSFVLIAMIPLVIGGGVSVLSYQAMRIRNRNKIKGVTTI